MPHAPVMDPLREFAGAGVTPAGVMNPSLNCTLRRRFDKLRPVHAASRDVPMTSLDEERSAQAQWKLRPEFANLRVFDELLEGEFITPADQHARQAGRLARICRFAATRVPHYQRLFEGLNLKPDAIRDAADLGRLPILTKWEIQEHERDFEARSLPTGERLHRYTLSSGTTGMPTRVLNTYRSILMFSVLSQRMYRWFRFDPAGKLAAIRSVTGLSPDQPPPEGSVMRRDRWHYSGQFFFTGPEVVLNYSVPISIPLEQQMEWLRQERPDYLISYPSVLEEQAFACVDRPPVDSLRAVLGISTQMTPAMRERIESVFGLPVHQNYGLNEIGLVAGRCEAGRYHVHAEHCVLEIVDESGRSCAPGEPGRIVVTGLNNLAMPLLRYDTDDTAMALGSECPCGRTLPSFGDISGRFRRWAMLPPDTRSRYRTVMSALNKLPGHLLRHIRRYQVHQKLDESLELRLVGDGLLPEQIATDVLQSWHTVYGPRDDSFRVVAVDRIEPGPGGKLQDLTSEFLSPALPS
jgi:phenylacetate-CoA ligase